jgi:hypothetical protein
MAQQNGQASFNTVTYKLPDGDLTLVSWDFVLGKLSEVVNPIIIALTAENESLNLIISKLNEWVDED